jgi:hypothetical protein
MNLEKLQRLQACLKLKSLVIEYSILEVRRSQSAASRAVRSNWRSGVSRSKAAVPRGHPRFVLVHPQQWR